MGTYLVMKNNMKRSLRHKPQFIIAFLLPVIMCLLFGLIKFDEVSLRVGVLGGDQSIIEELEQIAANAKMAKINYAIVNEDSMNTDLAMERYQLILDYRDSKQDELASQFTCHEQREVTSPFSYVKSIQQFKIISNYPKQKETYLVAAFQQSIANKTALSLAGMKSGAMSVTERSLATLLTLFLTISTIPCATMIRDKQYGIFTRYRYACSNGRGYVMGNVLYTFLLTLLQVSLCMVVLNLLQPEFHITLQAMIILTISITGIATIFATIICTTSKSEVQANITAASVAAVMTLLGGTFVSVSAMPWLLRMLSYASPIRWIVEMLRIC